MRSATKQPNYVPKKSNDGTTFSKFRNIAIYHKDNNTVLYKNIQNISQMNAFLWGVPRNSPTMSPKKSNDETTFSKFRNIAIYHKDNTTVLYKNIQNISQTNAFLWGVPRNSPTTSQKSLITEVHFQSFVTSLFITRTIPQYYIKTYRIYHKRMHFCEECHETAQLRPKKV